MLEFSVWKARIDEYNKETVDISSEGKAKKVMVNVVSARKDCVLISPVQVL